MTFADWLRDAWKLARAQREGVLGVLPAAGAQLGGWSHIAAVPAQLIRRLPLCAPMLEAVRPKRRDPGSMGAAFCV